MSGEHPQFPGKPWIAGDLRIPRALLAQIEAHAVASFPEECCGFLFGPADDAGLLDAEEPVENEANKYHQMDPETYPRDARTYFRLNPMKAMRRLDEAEAEARPLKVIYHSHCDADAYFSAEDAATFAQGKLLMWPCAYLVVSVHDGKVKEHRLHVHVPGTNDFAESTITVVDGD